MSAVTTTTVVTHQLGVGTQTWSSGLCDCFQDVKSCKLTLFRLAIPFTGCKLKTEDSTICPSFLRQLRCLRTES